MGVFLGKESPESSDEKDQKIIVVSPLPRENVGQSSGSAPTLPYSHGQSDFSSLTPPSSSVPISSLPMPISQNVTIKHFPLSSFYSNFPHHSSFQSSSTSLLQPQHFLLSQHSPSLLPLSFLLSIPPLQPFPALLGQTPVVLPEGDLLEVGKEVGVEVTPTTPPGNLII